MFKQFQCCLLLVILVLTSCNSSPGNFPTPLSSSTPAPTGLAIPKEVEVAATMIRPRGTTATASPGAWNCAENNSELPEIPTGEYQGWCKYENEKYRFSLAVPPTWGIRTSGENLIYIFPQSSSGTRLTVGFKQITEDIAIQRTEVGEGEIVTKGTVNFLGEQIFRDVLIYEEKVKAVLYNYAVETKKDNLIFTLSLDDWSTDHEAVSLSQEIQMTVDKIVESLEIQKP